MNSRIFAILVFLSFVVFAQAQHRYQLGLLPSINLKQKINKKWGLNFKFENQQQFKAGNFEDTVPFDYNYNRTDLALVASRKSFLTNKLAGGYMYRRKGKSDIHRLVQQFAFNKQYESFRLAHRIAADQTFESGEVPIFRFRYRLATELPLSGTKLDIKEFYFKINQEQLHIFEAGSYNLELRLVPVIGYALNKANKLEAGVNYRFSSFFTEHPRSQIWVALNWYYVL